MTPQRVTSSQSAMRRTLFGIVSAAAASGCASQMPSESSIGGNLEPPTPSIVWRKVHGDSAPAIQRRETRPNCTPLQGAVAAQRVPDGEVASARRALGTGDCAGARATLVAGLERYTATGAALATLGQALLCLGDTNKAANSFFCAGIAYEESGKKLEWIPASLSDVSSNVNGTYYSPETRRFSVHAHNGEWIVSGWEDPEGFPPLTVVKRFSSDESHRTCGGPVHVRFLMQGNTLQGVEPSTGRVLWTAEVPSKGSSNAFAIENCPKSKHFEVYSPDVGILRFERDSGKLTRTVLHRSGRISLLVNPKRGWIAESDYSRGSVRKFWRLTDGRFLGQIDLRKVIPPGCEEAPFTDTSGPDLTVVCAGSVLFMNLTDGGLSEPIALPRNARWKPLWHKDERLLLEDEAVPSERIIVDTKTGAVVTTEHPLVEVVEGSERPGWGIAKTKEWTGLVQLSSNRLVARAESDANVGVRDSKIALDPDGERAALCSNDNQVLVLAAKGPLLQRAQLPTGSCSEAARMEFVPTSQLLFTQPKYGSQILSSRGTWRNVDSKDTLTARLFGGRAYVRSGEYLDVHWREACCSPFKIRLPEQVIWNDYPRFALGGQMLIIQAGPFAKSRFLIHQLRGEAWVQIGEVAGRSGFLDGTGRFLVVHRDDGDTLRLDLSTMKEEHISVAKRIAWRSETFIFSNDGKQLFGIQGKCELATGECKSWSGGTDVLRKPVDRGHVRYWSSTQSMILDDDGRLLILDIASNVLRGALLAVGGRGWAFGMPSEKDRYTDLIEPIGWEPDKLDWFACLAGERVVPNQVCWEVFRRTGALQDALTGKR